MMFPFSLGFLASMFLYLVLSIAGIPALHSKILAKVELACQGVIDDVVPWSIEQHPAFMNEVGAVNNVKGLTDIMICDEDSQARIP
jgi:hypothetical protein